MRAFQVKAPGEQNQVWKQNLQEVLLLVYNSLGENKIRQDYKGGFRCLVDHVEWEIWCSTLGWEYKDEKKPRTKTCV